MGWSLDEYLRATPLFFDNMIKQYQGKKKSKQVRYYDDLPKGAW